MSHQWKYCPKYLDVGEQKRLVQEVEKAIKVAPLFCPVMPKSGRPFSVLMTNCGSIGWVSDKVGGYRYQDTHPTLGCPWPKIPKLLLQLWESIADWSVAPEACLINYYRPGAKLGSHRDTDELDQSAPIVLVSLGDDAIFHIGGLRRADPRKRILLKSGDLFVLAGTSRLCYHGVDRIVSGTSHLLEKGGRYSLTLRRVSRSPRS